MSGSRPSWPRLALRALGFGLVAALVLPAALMFGLLGLAHLAGGCGAGSSGGCEMGAASVGLVSIVPALVLGAGISLFRDLRRGRG
ncbi:hypothetical protein [Pseudotabrizicola algicola]|uniref:Uncharacterized protein n=1 Tax=Pseudotabrizicola algicola TaxID=2709381 RepID=A0A6B3RGB4_9RHOB|nr:hypothetical protein [Pseudotabrizicola algicola]NEX45050.1 hypothetical protein [Pseudotabrizicola algicola]